jgi:hypothetical protein
MALLGANGTIYMSATRIKSRTRHNSCSISLDMSYLLPIRLIRYCLDWPFFHQLWLALCGGCKSLIRLLLMTIYPVHQTILLDMFDRLFVIARRGHYFVFICHLLAIRLNSSFVA